MGKFVATYPRALKACASRLACVLTVLALSLQALVPSGYMVGASAHGGVEITLCTAQGNVSAIMLADGQIVAQTDRDHTPTDDTPDSPLCAFIGHNVVAQVPDMSPLLVVASFEATQSRQPAPSKPAPGYGLAAPPPPKTGPPVQA